MDATRNGDIWGVVHFPHNFSKFYDIRTTDGKESTNETIIGSRIAVTLDWSSELIINRPTKAMRFQIIV